MRYYVKLKAYIKTRDGMVVNGFFTLHAIDKEGRSICCVAGFEYKRMLSDVIKEMKLRIAEDGTDYLFHEGDDFDPDSSLLVWYDYK